jgi:hypothetical protein
MIHLITLIPLPISAITTPIIPSAVQEEKTAQKGAKP